MTDEDIFDEVALQRGKDGVHGLIDIVDGLNLGLEDSFRLEDTLLHHPKCLERVLVHDGVLDLLEDLRELVDHHLVADELLLVFFFDGKHDDRDEHEREEFEEIHYDDDAHQELQSLISVVVEGFFEFYFLLKVLHIGFGESEWRRALLQTPGLILGLGG